ncbi:hypothetical protein SESBI_15588 [Sesbania bispinosa]|nr:hypothetical protein SESBI_15588 [Sesbania bispinosa]
MSRRLKLWRRSRHTQRLTGTRLANAVAACLAKVELWSPLVQVAGRVVASRSQMVTDEQGRDANLVTDGAAETFGLKEGSGAGDGGSHERGRPGEWVR